MTKYMTGPTDFYFTELHKHFEMFYYNLHAPSIKGNNMLQLHSHVLLTVNKLILSQIETRTKIYKS